MVDLPVASRCVRCGICSDQNIVKCGADILLAAGCDYGQGYWYCRPIAAAALSERLRQQQEGALALPTP